jgi:hypothetical protein
MLLKFAAAVTATQVFQMSGKGEIALDAYSTNWGTATLTLTRDIGSGTYETLSVATDSTALLTGAALTITGDLSTPLTLGAGRYGITITNTPTAPIYLHLSHKYIRSDDNTNDYDAVS